MSYVLLLEVPNLTLNRGFSSGQCFSTIQLVLGVRQAGLPFAELLEGRSDDGSGADDAVPADPDVSQVPADDGLRLYDVLPVQHDVLRPAQHRQAAHSVS